MTAQAGGTRLRADARRNRDQILATAKAMFAEHGPDVPMEEIARRAGVGVGTLYRRFPDREALIRAVAQQGFGAVLEAARRAVAEEDTGWAALTRLVASTRELKLTLHLAFFSPTAWEIMRDDPTAGRFREELMDLLESIVNTAQREGSLREDVGVGDIALLVAMLLRGITGAASEVADRATERAMALILDGLRTGAGAHLPGTPITRADIDAR